MPYKICEDCGEVEVFINSPRDEAVCHECLLKASPYVQNVKPLEDRRAAFYKSRNKNR